MMTIDPQARSAAPLLSHIHYLLFIRNDRNAHTHVYWSMAA